MKIDIEERKQEKRVGNSFKDGLSYGEILSSSTRL